MIIFHLQVKLIRGTHLSSKVTFTIMKIEQMQYIQVYQISQNVVMGSLASR